MSVYAYVYVHAYVDAYVYVHAYVDVHVDVHAYVDMGVDVYVHVCCFPRVSVGSVALSFSAVRYSSCD